VFLPWGKEPDKEGLGRFLDLVFGCPTTTPTLDEHRMFLAFASATRSGELSRQVGAVLTNSLGDVLSIGSNDVPRRGGGTYWPTEDDARDHVKGEDSNTVTRIALMNEAAKELTGSGNSEDEKHKKIVDQLNRTSLRNITEFGRAVHAEMDALMACARISGSTIGSTMYVTTYPCHNCARHIIAAGVSRVVFIEPYPKSRSLDLHPDDLNEVQPGLKIMDPEEKVRLEPFVGIGPRRFIDYFSMSLGSGYLLKRKNENDGSLVDWNPKKAAPRLQASEAGYIATETLFASEITEFLQE
jgi:deoxycytidylate deaminase